MSGGPAGPESRPPGPLRRLMFWLLRTPAPPRPRSASSDGSPPAYRLFQAGRGFLRYRLLQWGSKQVSAAIGIGFGFAFLHFGSDWFLPEQTPLALKVAFSPLSWLLLHIEIIGLSIYLAQLPVTLSMVLLDYEQRWYEVTDRSLHIREGLVRIHQRTMSFANIQHLSIHQGPLQRLLGIADLEVRTAGGGEKKAADLDDEKAAGLDLHRGYLRGVDNADEIRDLILARLRRLRDAGLGDPDDSRVAEEQGEEAIQAGEIGEEAVLAAGQEVLREVRALARALRLTPAATPAATLERPPADGGTGAPPAPA